MRINIRVVGIIFLVLLMIQCGGKKEPAKTTAFAAELETLSEKVIASIEHTGSYENVGVAIDELSAELAAENITPTGAPFAVYYDAPDSVQPESLKWAVGIPVAPGTTVNPQSKLKIVRFPTVIYAYTVHTGSYERIAETYEQLGDWIDEQGLMVTGPAIEFFISGNDVPVESLQVKVGFVVEPAPDSVLEDEEEFEYEEETEPESGKG
jgi:effector-binding domain-containing protein